MTRLNFSPKLWAHLMHYYGAFSIKMHQISDYSRSHQFGAKLEVEGFQTF